MKKSLLLISLVLILVLNAFSQVADQSTYLKPVIAEMQKTWPNNKTINLVFHGHSVPSGYFATPTVNTIAAYPYTTLVNLKTQYPYTVLNAITTSIGGEQSEQGQVRFASEVLCMRPNVLFIDYAINDRGIGLERARAAWVKIIEAAQAYGCKVMLLTPTPISTESLTDPQNLLALHAQQIRDLASEYHVGLVDSYKAFQDLNTAGVNLSSYYAQANHVNEKGHKVVADEIKKWFTLTQAPSLDVHFDFENNTSTETTDKLSAVKGTFSGASVVTDIERGKVLSLPNAQSYLKINANPLYNSEFIISFWVKIPAEESWKNVLYFAETGGKNLICVTKEEWFPQKQLCFYNKSVAGVAGTTTKLDINSWHQITLTNSNGVSNLYLDGVKKSSTNILAVAAMTFTDFYIGTPDNTTAISFVDDVMIKKGKLTDSEVLSLYNSQKNTLQGVEKQGIANLKVFPNPVKKNESIKFELSDLDINSAFSYRITSLDGKQLAFKNFKNADFKSFSYFFEHEGVYLISFENKQTIKTVKLTVN
jgi:acyl-CoA thioesterase I